MFVESRLTRNIPPQSRRLYPRTESRSTVRFGARYTIGTWRADAALLFGATSNDPGFGVAAGFTYVFSGFRLP